MKFTRATKMLAARGFEMSYALDGYTAYGRTGRNEIKISRHGSGKDYLSSISILRLTSTWHRPARRTASYEYPSIRKAIAVATRTH